MIVIDANVVLDAYDTESMGHADAKRFLERCLSGDEPVGIPWLTILAFVRIRTNPRVYGLPLPLDEACSIVDSWLAQPNVQALSPGVRHWSILRPLLIDGQAKGPLTTDAHLAAMTIEFGGTLVTSDRDFARFPNLRVRGLTHE